MPESRKPLRELFIEALAIEGAVARAAYLQRACGAEVSLRQQIENLIQADARVGGFMGPATPEADGTQGTQRDPSAGGESSAPALVHEIVDHPSEQPGDSIGPYKLLQCIGEGGMGAVYMAEQEKPVRRRVALKVIKLGMDTRQVMARFEAEGQVLALMDHPNIAKVYEVGATAAGRPYLAMELVRGIKITDYCGKNRLSTRERVELCIKVCQALQHAHQKGIIHRDLKPSNILITTNDGVAVPKVIDFGIAKAIGQKLTDKTLFTDFQAFIGTPAYMSPEQTDMSSVDIDTRSDVYALGVLLYQLLTGRTPFNGKELLKSGLDELRRTIREDEPARPSNRLSTLVREELSTMAGQRGTDAPSLIRSVRGDLDWIVMKCLDKDRNRRYETANGLAMDLRRYLTHEPIVARPPTVTYRFQKALRRHRLAFTAGAVVALALLGGVGVSTWQAIRARRAEREQTFLRERADQSTKKAEQARANEAKVREASVKRLYDSLHRQVRATRIARRVGYRAQVFSLLRQARALDVPDQNLELLRSEAIACLGDFVGLTPIVLTNCLESDRIRMVKFAPDSRSAVFGLEDGSILIRQLPSGDEIARLTAGLPVRSLGFNGGSDHLVSVHTPDRTTLDEQISGATVCFWRRSVDGHWIEADDVSVPGAYRCLGSTEEPFVAVADPASHSLRLLSVKSGTLVERYQVPVQRDDFPKVCLSPEGRFLVIEESPSTAAVVAAAQVWDLMTDRRVTRLETRLSRLLSMGFSPNGKYLAILFEGGGVVYSTDRFQRLGVCRDYFEPPSAVAFQPHSTIVSLPIIQQNRIRLWNWASGQDEIVLDESETAHLVTFSPSGQYLITAGRRHAQLYRSSLGTERLNLPGHMSGVPGTGFSPDGRRIASVSKDRSIQVRESLTAKVIWESNDLPGPGQSVAFTTDGRLLATTDYETDRVLIWDAQTGRRLLALGTGEKERIWSVRFSPDRRFLVTASTDPGTDTGIKIWNLEMPAPDAALSTLKARLVKTLPGKFWSLEMSPDGRRVGFFDRGGPDTEGLYVWDFLTDRPPRLVETNLINTVQSESFTPDGRHLLLVGSNRELVTLDVETGETVASIPTRTSTTAQQSTGYANLSLSPDGTKLAIASDSNRGVDIWDPVAGKLLYSLPEQNGTVWWLAWTPDSRRLSVSCGNGDIAVWSLADIDKVLDDLGLVL